jgi:hypothetical protein
MSKHLLAIVELGGYPDFSPLYRDMGYRVTLVTLMRKAIKQIKQLQPDIVVAEFNYQPDFRERTSNLESLFATVQNLAQQPKIIVLYETLHQPQLDKFRARFDNFEALPFPIDEGKLRALL